MHCALEARSSVDQSAVVAQRWRRALLWLVLLSVLKLLNVLYRGKLCVAVGYFLRNFLTQLVTFFWSLTSIFPTHSYGISP